jgi:hypothetical protein
MSGRPSVYSKELAETICERIAAGEYLTSILLHPDMPAESTVLLWAADDREGFEAMYRRARRARAYKYVEELMDVADGGDAELDNAVKVARDKLKVETRKWFLAKNLAKDFGDKIDVDHRTPDGPLQVLVTRRIVDPGAG